MRFQPVRILQTMIFIAALAALVGVVSLSFLTQKNRRIQEEQTQAAQAAADQTATAVPAATAAARAAADQTATAVPAATAAARARRTATQAAGETLQAARWVTQRISDQRSAEAWATWAAATVTATPPPTPSPPVIQPVADPGWPQLEEAYTIWTNIPCTRTLDLTAPTDRDIALFLDDCYIAADRYAWSAQEEIASGVWDVTFARQEADLDGDGQPEIVFTWQRDWRPNVAVLDRTEAGWQLRTFLVSQGHYCALARANVQGTRVVVEFLSCWGGTGLLMIDWAQVWIDCAPTACSVVWHAGLVYAERTVQRYENSHAYAVPVVTQPDPTTVLVTVYSFGVRSILRGVELDDSCHGALWQCTSRRSVGPVIRVLYHWNGAAYARESTETLAPATRIWREEAFETEATAALLAEHLARQYIVPDGMPDMAGLRTAWAALWGIPPPGTAAYASWGPEDRWPEAATHDGRPGELGEWIAGVIGARDSAACRLSVYRHTGDQLALVGRTNAPCTANLSRLAWADVTGDGRHELLWLTVPGDSDAQELRIYTVGEELHDLAVLEGALNGPDGAGIRWTDRDGDGVVELEAGLPLLDLAGRETDWYDWPGWPAPARRFQVYRWDPAAGALTPGEIVTRSFGGP